MMRSWLFVPGHRASMIDKACDSGADAVILDLEDSVPLSEKDTARHVTGEALARHTARSGLWVRVNPLDGDRTGEDVRMAIEHRADGVILPKAEGADSLRHLAKLVASDSLPPVLAIATESAASIFAIESYREVSSLLAGLSWGAEDLSADLGSAGSRDSEGRLTGPFALARNLALFGAVAAGIEPIDTVWTDIKDLDGLEAECIAARRDGFTGKLAIHPTQVPIINRCFLPSEEELDEARRIVAAFDANPALGAVSLDGRMIDMPHLKNARALLERKRSG